MTFEAFCIVLLHHHAPDKCLHSTPVGEKDLMIATLVLRHRRLVPATAKEESEIGRRNSVKMS